MRAKRKSVFFWLLLAVLLGAFVYSAYRIGSYWLAHRRSQMMAEEASEYVRVTETPGLGKESAQKWVEVDFSALREINGDVVAWLYGPGTEINYPVVQAEDNEYYLYRLLDRTWNVNGSLFLDFRCAPDFSDENSLIYGHNMKTGAMFGSLVKYKEQSYYDAHPYLYLTTPDRKYRVELFAGCVIPSDAELYQSGVTPEYLQECIDRSTFSSGVETVPEGAILTLTTCSYEFQNARYAVLGVLVPIE